MMGRMAQEVFRPTLHVSLPGLAGEDTLSLGSPPNLAPKGRPSIQATALHFCVCLKYRRSGGGWSFLAGISSPSPLRK
jgi:hypothetical protein